MNQVFYDSAVNHLPLTKLLNTPGHYILNLAFLGKTIAPKNNIALAIGAVIPDVPIFVFYFVAKYSKRQES